MAGVAECWGGAVDGAVGVKNLRGMATQAPDAVNITGGKIGSDVVIEGGTALVWGLSPQQLYDVIFQPGSIQLFAIGTSPVVPPIILASWQQVPGGYAVVTTTGADVGTATAGSWQTDDAGGVNAWTGAVANTTLGMTQVPAALPVLAYALTGAGGQLDAGSTAKITQDLNVGGSQPHGHAVTVPAVPAHHHTLTPPKLALAAWRRIS